jgi:hypothetical protein
MTGNGKPDHRAARYSKQYDDPSKFSLSADEKALIRENAKLQVAKELKDREEKQLYDMYLEEERKAILPEEQTQPIWLTLSPHMPFIRLDNTIYLNETCYYVNSGVFSVLTEQMARGWNHEEETEVRDARTRRRAHIPVALSTRNFGDNRSPHDLKVTSAQLATGTPEALLGIR